MAETDEEEPELKEFHRSKETGELVEFVESFVEIEYPKKVPGGIYGDVAIDVGQGYRLVMRSLLVRACINCDGQDKCWEKVKGKVPADSFLENVECQAGLKKFLG